MNLARQNKWLIFIAVLVLFLLFPSRFGTISLFPFAPFLVVTLYQCSYVNSLWAACICGVAQDLFSSHDFFAAHTLAYCAATALLYRQRRNFFPDRLTTLPLMVFFLCLIVMIVFSLLAKAGLQPKKIGENFLHRDMLLWPLWESALSITLFVVPCWLLSKRQRRASEYFF